MALQREPSPDSTAAIAQSRLSITNLSGRGGGTRVARMRNGDGSGAIRRRASSDRRQIIIQDRPPASDAFWYRLCRCHVAEELLVDPAKGRPQRGWETPPKLIPDASRDAEGSSRRDTPPRRGFGDPGRTGTDARKLVGDPQNRVTLAHQ